jgi:hypothetical protein
MPVNATHPDYAKALHDWELCTDAVKGSASVKAGTTKYLPQPNPTDTTSENMKRYEQYLLRANYVNFTGQTEDGFMGMVERKDHNLEKSGDMDEAADNIDGCGLSLFQSFAGSIRGLLRTGRDGLLVDIAPNETGDTSRRATANLMPFIRRYKAQSIINWREEVVGGVKVLNLVVLKEQTEVVDIDGFNATIEDQYRVLSLVEGVYVQQVYDKDLMPIDEPVAPRDASGATLDYIPFQFIGSEENDTKIDKATLIDLAYLNIAHYRNSADFEESSFLVGQPTPVLSGLSQSWVKDVLKDTVHLGSRAAIPLPVDASATLLQADPNQMPSKGMEMKEVQAVKLGALIIQDAGGNETAEAAKIRYAGQNSKLGRVIKNTQQAYLNAIQWMQDMMSNPGDEVELELNMDFFDASIDPQVIIAEMQQFDRGILAMSDIRRNARKRGQIAHDRTDEEIEEENGTASPLE